LRDQICVPAYEVCAPGEPECCSEIIPTIQLAECRNPLRVLNDVIVIKTNMPEGVPVTQKLQLLNDVGGTAPPDGP
jgi:hypothetical protein